VGDTESKEESKVLEKMYINKQHTLSTT